MANLIDLNKIANGALLEMANREMKKILENIADPNTKESAKRSLTITLTFEPSKGRDVASTDIQVKSKLVPRNGASTNFIIGEDSNGVTGGEMKSNIPGQLYMDEDGDVKDDLGNNVEEEKKVAKLFK